MKWKDLSLKERKQIYDSVRANNPDATYLDIKQQFDSIFKIEPDGNTSRVMQDYNVTLNPDSYMSGTANHELGHVADGLAGSRKIVDFDGGGEYITNPYLYYLANPNNTYSSAELRKMGMHSAANNRAYLLNPTEAKSHMLTLKRALKDSGKITNWSTPVDENMVLEYIKSPTPNKLIHELNKE